MLIDFQFYLTKSKEKNILKVLVVLRYPSAGTLGGNSCVITAAGGFAFALFCVCARHHNQVARMHQPSYQEILGLIPMQLGHFCAVVVS